MRMTLLLVALVMAGSDPADAQTPVGSPVHLWSRVIAGDTVYVIDGSGQEITGVFARVSDVTLSLLVGGQRHDVPMKDVRVVSMQKDDSNLNGFLIGAGIGAAITAVGMTEDCEGSSFCIDFPPAYVAVGAALGGLAFGGVGALIDHLIKGRTVIFKAANGSALHLQPGLSLNPHGAAVSLTLSR